MPQPPSAGSKPIPGRTPDDGVQWYISDNGESRGPIDSPTLNQWISNGDVQSDMLVWRAGYDDWRPAGDCLPDQFVAPRSPLAKQDAGNGGAADLVRSSGTAVPADIVESLTNQRHWVTTLIVILMTLSGLLVVHFVTAMLVSDYLYWMPVRGSRSTVYGLTGLIACGIQIAGEILLLNYAASLRVLKRRRDLNSLRLAAKRLGTFWKYCGIAAVAVLVLLIGTALLIFVVGTTAAIA